MYISIYIYLVIYIYIELFVIELLFFVNDTVRIINTMKNNIIIIISSSVIICSMLLLLGILNHDRYYCFRSSKKHVFFVLFLFCCYCYCCSVAGRYALANDPFHRGLYADLVWKRQTLTQAQRATHCRGATTRNIRGFHSPGRTRKWMVFSWILLQKWMLCG